LELELPTVPVLPAPAPASVAVPVFLAAPDDVVFPPAAGAPVLVQTNAGPVATDPVVSAVNPEFMLASAAECSFDQLTRADS